MKRQRRKRSTRRRGLQHIGDVLSTILTDLDQEESQQTRTVNPHESNIVPVASAATAVAAVSVGANDSQNTFSFYQPAPNT